MEHFWELPNGFFYRLRQGDYDPTVAAVVESVLRSIDINDQSDLPRRLVSLIWTIPTFMEWQIDRVRENHGDIGALRRDITRLTNTLNDVLGSP